MPSDASATSAPASASSSLRMEVSLVLLGVLPLGVPLMRRKLLWPELAADLSDLVGARLPLGVGGQQMVFAAIAEHLHHLVGRLLEQAHRGEVLVVLRTQRCRRLQAQDARPRALVDAERVLHARLQLAR